jgi:D-alanyl-D-alanine carboxypeptidase
MLAASTAVAVISLFLSGCATTATPSDSSSVSAGAKSRCVADPAAVVADKLPATASGPVSATLGGALQTKVAAAMKEVAATGAVVSVQTPKGTWTQAFGLADPSTGAPMTTDVYQRIGSITKTFTGTLILQLAEEGKLKLTDPIDKYVSDIPNGSTVTLATLINMTSGLASYTLDSTWQKQYFADPNKVWTPDELVDAARRLKPIFKPGAQYNYSNTNTILLGKVVEAVTGDSIENEYEKRIIRPLHLTHTSFAGASAAFPSPHAEGFTMQSPTATPSNPTNATDWNPSWGWSAGEMISTVPDLLTYGRALVTGQGLLSAAAQEKRLTSFPADRGTYSYGYALGCIDGWVGHTGELPGYNTAVYFQTDSNTVVTILTNTETLSGDCTTSATLANNQKGIPCDAPTGRILSAVGQALGHPFTAPAQS